MNEPREARTRPSGTALNALFPGASAVAGAVAGSQCRLNFIFKETLRKWYQSIQHGIFIPPAKFQLIWSHDKDAMAI